MKDEPVFEYHADAAIVEIELPDSTKKQIKTTSGWSFGTGGHETTRLCIQALEHLFKTEEINSVLDIGCGSGILSIASSALGAEKVTGIDIDSSIIDEAMTNSRNNGFADKVNFSTTPVSEVKETFDLVSANILLKTILSLLHVITERVQDRGYFIASGIKEKDLENAVISIENSGFGLFESYLENEWAALTFQKKA